MYVPSEDHALKHPHPQERSAAVLAAKALHFPGTIQLTFKLRCHSSASEPDFACYHVGKHPLRLATATARTALGQLAP